MNASVAENINILGRFCGKQDIPELSHPALLSAYGIEKADVMVLFGGSILAGGDLLAKAIQTGIAGKYIIVGGEGHTTETLRQQVHKEYPFIETEGLPEAVVFQKYLQKVHNCRADYLETRSTNCGNNITCLLHLLKEERIPYSSIILCQDATMQNRMDAGLRKYAERDLRIINYPTYRATVCCDGGMLVYDEHIHGMWSIERYVNLLMGEIPRLKDDSNGYGPFGKGFISHVDIPPEVQDAFTALREVFGGQVREANPLFASSDS